MSYSVTVLQVEPQWIAAARAPLVKGEVPRTMLGLLTKGWDFVRKSGIKNDGQNVAIYRNKMIEAGPRVLARFESDGDVGCVATPSGLAAMVIHMGPYELLGKAHAAVHEWCVANGHEFEGASWEVYGHHEDDPSKRRTDIYYLLRS